MTLSTNLSDDDDDAIDFLDSNDLAYTLETINAIGGASRCLDADKDSFFPVYEPALLFYKGETIEFQLIGKSILAGRISKSQDPEKGCDCVLPDLAIGENHFRIDCRDGFCTITNLHTNGTFVNGLKVGVHEQRNLVNGDEIRAGYNTIITFYSPPG